MVNMKIIYNNKEKIKKEKTNRKWKEENNQYLCELQRFFDRVDNIEDNELKNSIIRQVMICDEILTKIAESKFDEFYKEGYKEAKNG